MTSIRHAIMALQHRFLPWSGLVARLVGALWQGIRLAYRVLLMWPAIMLVSLLAGSLLMVQYTEPEGARRVLEAYLVDSILAVQADPAGYLSGCQSREPREPTAQWPEDTPPIQVQPLIPCEPELMPVAQVVSVTVDGLGSVWFSLVILSIVLEVITRFIGFSSPQRHAYASASGVVVDGRFVSKEWGTRDE